MSLARRRPRSPRWGRRRPRALRFRFRLELTCGEGGWPWRTPPCRGWPWPRGSSWLCRCFCPRPFCPAESGRSHRRLPKVSGAPGRAAPGISVPARESGPSGVWEVPSPWVLLTPAGSCPSGSLLTFHRRQDQERTQTSLGTLPDCWQPLPLAGLTQLVTVCSGVLSQEGSLLASPLQGFRMLSVVHLNEIVGIGTVNLNSLCTFSLVLGAHCFRLFLCLCKYNLKILIIRISIVEMNKALRSPYLNKYLLIFCYWHDVCGG